MGVAGARVMPVPVRPVACEHCGIRDRAARDGHVCILDVVAVAADGGAVLVVGDAHAVPHVGRDIERLLRSHAGAVTEVRRTAGAERISLLSGGVIRFARSEHAMRGQSADVVFIAGRLDAWQSRMIEEAAHAVTVASHVPDPVRWLAW